MDVRRSVKPGSWRLGVLAAITALVVTACGGAAQSFGTGRGVGRPAAVRGARQRPGVGSAGQRRRR